MPALYQEVSLVKPFFLFCAVRALPATFSYLFYYWALDSLRSLRERACGASLWCDGLSNIMCLELLALKFAHGARGTPSCGILSQTS